MNINIAINEGSKILRKKFIPNYKLDSEILMAKTIDQDRKNILLNSNKIEGNAPKFKADQYLGDFISSTENVRIVFRDHQEPDGDRVQIRFNDDIIYPNILLTQRYKKMDVKLLEGFNKIDFVALNQGESGPNTAEVRVYDDDGNVMMSNLWNLATGTKATFIVVKQDN